MIQNINVLLNMKLNKLLKNQSGFSLTEVMIGIMILTIAIVAATSVLTTLVRTNADNLTTMKAYYFAQEGLEGVRNIRDTNWLHNRGWLDDGGIWGGDLADADAVGINLNYSALNSSNLIPKPDSTTAPWSLGGDGKIYRNDSVDFDDVLFDASSATGEDSGFTRTITVEDYSCENDSCKPGDEDSYMLVTSTVTWSIGARERELTLSEVLTDWKGGIL